jgi:threonine dehydrogenase-like Zn-dependent dehydrogenase
VKAAVLRAGELVVDTLPDPQPGPLQTLVRTLACGICGSDLHFVHHGRRLTELSAEGGGRGGLDHEQDIVMGHEFVAEVLEHGPGSAASAPAVGSVVVSMPIMFTALPPGPENVTAVGYSNEFNGGYAEMMRLFTPMLLTVPNGLPVDHAALTEPMAVGLHAVNRANLAPGESVIVHGCGPVGLAVIAALQLLGERTIVAADFSPARRALAARLGATVVVDPAVDDVWDVWQREAGSSSAGSSTVVQFEAIGVQGMLNRLMQRAPRHSRIVVVGVCMELDTITPIWGINKELNLQFVLGYTAEEFSATLGHLAEGRIDGSPLITGRVGLDQVSSSFASLANPEQHVKILVHPNQ